MTDEARTILVTGATGGIGTAVSHQLAASGYSLVLAARDETKLKTLSNELTGDGHVWLQLDMTISQSVNSGKSWRQDASLWTASC
ncbi:SDR family NAD(P)-dependent oxidoreductase [Rhizobium leguminosarum]|uniref:SDR family NAD(P)-dependent oxidoreductase n=1 Tax=Rhizobium leguminosarum TaxID=384 RepID=UPI0021BBCA69|nr:SDR family NAD(P)-dependent oxidoreductase [Rhizobium leguminosarum]